MKPLQAFFNLRMPSVLCLSLLISTHCRKVRSPVLQQEDATLIEDTHGLTRTDSNIEQADASSLPSPKTSKLNVSWRSLIAAEAWSQAAETIDLLPQDEKQLIHVRLARAYAAVGIATKQECEFAIHEIAQLRLVSESKPIADVLNRLEVDAMVCAERWKEALEAKGSHALTSRYDYAARLKLVRAYEGSGAFEAAQATLSRLIASQKPSEFTTGELLLWHLKIAQQRNDTSAVDTDRKRIFIEYPKLFERELRSHLTELPKLSANEWLQRAEALATLGRVDEALQAITQAETQGSETRTIVRSRARMLYKAKAYTLASHALEEASKLAKDNEALDDAFHAARAKSRAGDDDAAIAAYETIALANPHQHWGAEAAFLAGNLRFLQGRWPQAIENFERYLKGPWSQVRGQESNVREARHAHAIALLEANELNRAKSALTQRIAQTERQSLLHGRFELMLAIAYERASERSKAIALLKKLTRQYAFTSVDLAARRRLQKLNVKVTPWPTFKAKLDINKEQFSPRVSLLIKAGLESDALTRWRWEAPSTKRNYDPERCLTFLQFGSAHEAFSLGIKLRISGPPDHSEEWAWHCAYPTPYAEVVAALEQREQLPRGLLHSILRQESAFRTDVTSHAGAIGVAQLMPSTAEAIMKKHGITPVLKNEERLRNVYLQLDLAARYLHDVLDELSSTTQLSKDQIIPLAIAAYNAGAGSVKKWLALTKDTESDLFLERIVFVETRNYTHHVLSNLVHYSILAGISPPTLADRFTK